MSIIRVSKPDRFVVMDKTGLEDSRLSFKARGLLAYLLSKPDDWMINADLLAHDAPDGGFSVRSALKELQRYKYLERERVQHPDGTWGWEHILYERPADRTAETASRIAISRSRKTAVLTEQGSTDFPPTPVKRGLRANGTNPRALAAKAKEEEKRARSKATANCSLCNDNGLVEVPDEVGVRVRRCNHRMSS